MKCVYQSSSVALSKCLEVCILCYLTDSFETKYLGTRSSIGLVSGVGSLDIFQHGNDLTTGVVVACLLWDRSQAGAQAAGWAGTFLFIL